MMKKILITGGSGFIGSQLVQRWIGDGHELWVLTRHPKKLTKRFPAVKAISSFSQCDEQFDWLINLAGEGIASNRWTDSRKAVLRASRIQTTVELARWAKRTEQKFEVVLSGSAIGYYGSYSGAEVLHHSEDSPAGNDFAARLCSDWELAAAELESVSDRLVYLRTGVVLGSQGGMLAQVSTPFKLGLGGRLGHGQQVLSWIHQHDYINAIDFLLHQPISGAVNMTAPKPVTNAEFTRALAKQLHRPAIFPMPSPIARILFGEMSDLILKGQSVLPSVLQQYEFEFQYPSLESALSHL